MKISQNTLMMISGSFAQAITVFYIFISKNDTFVLLHQFRKKTQKTPKREIERAKTERDDYLARKEAE